MNLSCLCSPTLSCCFAVCCHGRSTFNLAKARLRFRAGLCEEKKKADDCQRECRLQDLNFRLDGCCNERTEGCNVYVDRSFDASTSARTFPKRTLVRLWNSPVSNVGLRFVSTASCCCLSFHPFSSDLSKSLLCRVCSRTMEATLMVFFVLDIRSSPIQREALVSCSTRLQFRFLSLVFRYVRLVVCMVLSCHPSVVSYGCMPFVFVFSFVRRHHHHHPYVAQMGVGSFDTRVGMHPPSLLSHPQRKRCRCRSYRIQKGTSTIPSEVKGSNPWEKNHTWDENHSKRSHPNEVRTILHPTKQTKSPWK